MSATRQGHKYLLKEKTRTNLNFRIQINLGFFSFVQMYDKSLACSSGWLDCKTKTPAPDQEEQKGLHKLYEDQKEFCITSNSIMISAPSQYPFLDIFW